MTPPDVARPAASVDVVVIGAGWAGLAAAVALVQGGRRVEVLEAATAAGGRARRVTLHGLPLDNGHHLLMGAYRATLALLDTVGAPRDGLHRMPLTLHVPDHLALQGAPLPAPLGLAVGLLRADGLQWRERLAAVRLLTALRHAHFRTPPGETAAQLFARTRQPARLVHLLWAPLCVAALNTEIENADAQVLANVLRDALCDTRAASDFLLPARDLGALLPDPAARWLDARGSPLRVGCAVRAVVPQPGGGFVVEHARGITRAEHVVVATDPARAAGLLRPLPALAGTADALAAMPQRAIVSLYLQYPPHVRLAGPLLGSADEPVQWWFDRSDVGGQPGLIGAVISAATAQAGMPHAALVDAAHAQLARCVPALPAPRWSQVIHEKRATFACVPGVFRPSARTAVDGLWLAGDYTAGDYPATLEGAVRSGNIAAAGVLAAPARPPATAAAHA